MSKTETKELAAAKAGMDVKTARKYLADGRLSRIASHPMTRLDELLPHRGAVA